MVLALVDLTEQELAARSPQMIAGFAATLAANHGVAPAAAEAESRRQFAALLPAGIATAGQLLWKVVDDGTEVGFIWVSLPGTAFPGMAWLAEIEMAEAHRGHGLGTRAVAATEDELRRRGVHTLGLHVFGSNTGARRLYDRLGYRTFHQVRSRPLRSVPPPGPAVTLVPMTQDGFTARVAALAARDPLALARDPAAGSEAALRAAETMAPSGVRTEGVFLRTVHTPDGRPVGWIWFALPQPLRPTGHVHHVEIEPGLRRRGLGRAALAAAEAELAQHAVSRFGLGVPGEPAALAFADALDLPVSSQQMYKRLLP